MNNRYMTWIAGVLGAILLITSVTIVGKTAISEIAGLAVAQTATLWNNVRDASAGDALSAGVMASQLYYFNGTTFDRARGGIPFGLQVDVTRLPGSTQTPADGFANPTTFSGSWSLVGIFNGTTWDRIREVSGDAVAITGLLANGNMVFNGTTWDRMRSGSAISDFVSTETGVLATQIVGLNPFISGATTVGRIGASGAAQLYTDKAQSTATQNSTTTGAAASTTTVTLAASTTARNILHRIDTFCSAGTSTLSIAFGGTTVWTSATGAVPAAPSMLSLNWVPGLTHNGINKNLVVTVTTCGASNTSTINVMSSLE